MFCGVPGSLSSQDEWGSALLRVVFRAAPGAVWAVDRDLSLTHATGRLVEVAGLRSTDVVGSRLQDLLGTRDPSNPGIAHHLAALAGERQSFDYRFAGRLYRVAIDPLLASDGAVVGCVGAAFDVTERRAAEERLARSESRLVEAQRTAHVGSFEWDIRSNVLTWTAELGRTYGLEPGLSAGTIEDVFEHVHPQDLDQTRRALFDAARRAGPFGYEHRIIRRDGTIRSLQTRGEAIADAAGHIVRLVGSGWDVTELTEATQARERVFSLLHATIDATAEGTLVVDRERKVVMHNRRFMELWNVPSHLADGKNDVALLAHLRAELEDPVEFMHQVDDLYASPELAAQGQLRCKDGRILEWSSGPQRIGDAVVGRVWSFRDVSEREGLLRRALFLSDATRLLASLDVEQALVAVARISLPFMGDACAIDVFGTEGPRRLVTLSRDPAIRISSELHAGVLAGQSVVYQVGPSSCMGVPLLVKGSLAGAITFQVSAPHTYEPSDLEIAEELARRAALALDNAQLYRRAQDALRTRDEFLSVAAHEIRGPLTAIHLAAQTIKDGKAPPASVPGLLSIIERQDRQLSQFADELVDMGKIREGRLRLHFEPVSLGEVVRDVAAQLDRDLVRSGSALSIVVDDNLVGQWDGSRLRQVVSNLLSNAIKFGMGRPIRIKIRARDGRALLTVEDHGIGIRPEVLPRLFSPFERGVSGRNYGGLGLGLHIVKTIVEATGGSVRAESTPHAGTVFTVELPTDPIGPMASVS
jgi:PAS domain S-box-containing protein